MARLTKDLKDRIVRKAIKKSGVLEEEEKIRIRTAEFAEACRVEAIGGPEKAERVEPVKAEIERLLAQFPQICTDYGFFKTDHAIRINVAGERRIHVDFTGHTGRAIRSDRIEKISPDSFTIQSGSELEKEYYEIDRAADKLKEKRGEIEANVRAVLNSVNTTKQLLDVWPESAELIPSDVDAPVSKALAVPLKDLNAALNLRG